jgi:hypothetical protein
VRVALAEELGGIGGGTAYQGLVDRGRLQAGQTVLITAAAGGVGSAAVQIAAALGARPLGTARPGNHDYLRGLGAAAVFDYHAADWARQAAGGTQPPGRRRHAASPGPGGTAAGPGPPGADPGRQPAHPRQDRAADRTVAAPPVSHVSRRSTCPPRAETRFGPASSGQPVDM